MTATISPPAAGDRTEKETPAGSSFLANHVLGKCLRFKVAIPKGNVVARTIKIAVGQFPVTTLRH